AQAAVGEPAEGVVGPPPGGDVAVAERRGHGAYRPLIVSGRRHPHLPAKVRTTLAKSESTVTMNVEPADQGCAVLTDHEYHPLVVAAVVDETADTRSFVLQIPPELERAFVYTAGQFCTFRAV